MMMLLLLLLLRRCSVCVVTENFIAALPARRFASAVLAVAMFLSVSVSVCPKVTAALGRPHHPHAGQPYP